MQIYVVIESDHGLDNKEIARELLDKACANIAMSDLELMDGHHFKFVIKKLIAELDKIIEDGKKASDNQSLDGNNNSRKE